MAENNEQPSATSSSNSPLGGGIAGKPAEQRGRGRRWARAMRRQRRINERKRNGTYTPPRGR